MEKRIELAARIDSSCSANFSIAADGTFFRIDSGETTVTENTNGFSLQAGEEERWTMMVTCLGKNTAHVEITLSNKCDTLFETHATATARTVIQDGISSLYIAPYLLEWTCGEAVSCQVSERWELHTSGY